jgi:hypothetical protein
MDVAEVFRTTQTLADLPAAERILTWYRDSWERIARDLALQERRLLEGFLCLMAAVQAPVSETQVQKLLGWANADLDWALDRVRGFLVRRVQRQAGYDVAYLELRHQTVLDYLASVKYRGPARGGLASTHAHIADHYLDLAKRAGWVVVEPYGRYYVVRHLILSDDRESFPPSCENSCATRTFRRP